ncbi:DnaE-like error-prone DNA polymerase [Prauserella shujinwangii]|uniref:Error-prone DNA polymerase n=1 Tax=Prauserella shujinwangii TaxID=1453103 RepID=A0A2T0LQ18_9PSEU|nr:error-prone DNA polymerase [Prauserella shujinwangii]PRX45446.1 DnaE-like error-prone DNA polymerase [Prauserella shujinwangii]
MSFNNPGVSWTELERALSGAPPRGDGGDSPAWSRRREGYAGPPPDLARPRSGDGVEIRVPYAELHTHSHFSFLDGASSPEALVEEAVRAGLDGITLTDHDGLYGVVRFAEAARELGMRTGYGAELSLGLPGPQNGEADPVGEHLLVLARGLEGYRRLCRVLSNAHLRGEEKGRPVYDLDEVVEELRGHCVVLTGCRKGAVRRALDAAGPRAALAELRKLVDRFGRHHVAVELTDHGLPGDSARNDLLAALAAELGQPTIAANNVHYARPGDGRLAAAVAAVRARRSIADLAGWLPPAPAAFVRSGAEMRARFRRYPGAVQRAAVLGVECAFDLRLVAPDLPPFPVPEGHTEISYLRELTWAGAARRYGAREQAPGAYAQLDHELGVIEELGFPGYFLVVWDIVEFARSQGILCQGRGSAANSAVCFALGITHADPVRWGLLFERFLAPERDGPPDIDVDIESDRREEVIQYVYRKHGRRHAAQVANVITYRARSAVRDMAKALGYSAGQQDAWAKRIDRWGPVAEVAGDGGIPEDVLTLANRIGDAPRHLGIHSGGMVICERPVSEVVPVEWARMAGRTVLQWDKDDCASIGLVKFDLLGLGMLSALHYAIDLVAEHEGVEVDLARLDLADPEVYDMLCRADAIGVFQVESRAQLATLPRLRPREFYDLVVEVALIRPGPIQGGSVHPYIRRRNGEEEWKHPHPLLAASLDRTYGVPLFQEQVMQMAIDVASFTPAEADQLRRAMGAKRSGARMERLRERFFSGAAANGIGPELAERIFAQIHAFSGYGFPEAHSMSFALLVYASAYLKRYHPAAFCAALLRAQPMGFYAPQSLVADARRHGIVVHGPDLNASLAHATLEPDASSEGGHAVRVGLAGVRGLGPDLAERIVTERAAGEFTGLDDLARRVRLTEPQLEALATAGAFARFGSDRRRAIWAAGAAARHRPEHLPGLATGLAAPALPGMSTLDLAAADVWATGISPGTYPTEFVREYLDRIGAVPAARLLDVADGTRVRVGGAVTHRQRPATAGGITFLNLEDETGMVNVVCSRGLWRRQADVARNSPALLVRGIVQNAHGVTSLVADHLTPLDLRVAHRSRDFR